MNVESLKKNLAEIIANNYDGHLSLHEVMILREVKDFLERKCAQEKSDV